jgi:Phytanoyl-CoA dioxygenase (PhyH)
MLNISKDIEYLIAQADMTVLSVPIYRALGVAILRKAISPSVVKVWQAAWQAFQAETIATSRTINPFNPVVLNEPVQGELASIYRHPELLDIMEEIYPDLGIFGHRFLIKDKQSRTPVFFHQDYGYDLGWPEKTSVFLPLSPMTPENGGLAFLPGTNQLGYLGDVGDIAIDVIAPDWPVLRPILEPGDIVVMHECTWHGSGPHISGPDRVVVQLQYQPASDPSSVELLRGKDSGTLKLADSMRPLIFRRSRATRLRDLQAEVNRKATVGIRT